MMSLFKLLDRIAARIGYRKLHFYLAPAGTGKLDDTDLLRLDPDSVHAWVERYRAADWDRAEIEGRFRLGAQAYGLRAGDDIVAVAWVLQCERFYVGELDRTVDFPKSLALLWDGMTLPAARGRGHYKRFMMLLQDALPESVAYVDYRNHGARRSIEAAGFTHWKTMRRVRRSRRASN